MQQYTIEGGNRLAGVLPIQGAKNSALPLLAATILTGSECTLHNCPRLSDVSVTIRILRHLGCRVTEEGNTVTVDSACLCRQSIPEELMREMRSSIIFLGAVAARCGGCRLSFPGGCELGPRPIDLHLAALSQMGLHVAEDHGYLSCTLEERFHGEEILLSFPSVGATENILLAAVLADGVTVINNAAREPEVVDLACFLNACGARISGAGESSITIEGVKRLGGCEYTVIPDRIVAATYLTAAAMTGGDIQLTGTDNRALAALVPIFTAAGCELTQQPGLIRLRAPERLHAAGLIRTMPYPGFPTDAQAPVMAMMSIADGTSIFVENVFSSRFQHAGELCRMGADIQVEGRVAVVQGVKRLHSAPVEAGDLRGGAGLVLAALSAQGRTVLRGVEYIDRGYENLEGMLNKLGANIQREPYEKTGQQTDN